MCHFICRVWSKANPKNLNKVCVIPMGKFVLNYARSSQMHPCIKCDHTIHTSDSICIVIWNILITTMTCSTIFEATPTTTIPEATVLQPVFHLWKGENAHCEVWRVWFWVSIAMCDTWRRNIEWCMKTVSCRTSHILGALQTDYFIPTWEPPTLHCWQ